MRMFKLMLKLMVLSVLVIGSAVPAVAFMDNIFEKEVEKVK